MRGTAVGHFLRPVRVCPHAESTPGRLPPRAALYRRTAVRSRVKRTRIICRRSVGFPLARPTPLTGLHIDRGVVRVGLIAYAGFSVLRRAVSSSYLVICGLDHVFLAFGP
ncbi:hypothetical protein EVAR_95738_1 [Eumeta japonica]|uniref:Uncharacterized protein n=1 Tax=Eumeta variegata TaxID=151549 RepID=A0A4C1ULU9_EUMVA|nr:hypothetical protein EVAR_95738_1 [Eumeta japonica]